MYVYLGTAGVICIDIKVLYTLISTLRFAYKYKNGTVSVTTAEW